MRREWPTPRQGGLAKQMVSAGLVCGGQHDELVEGSQAVSGRLTRFVSISDRFASGSTRVADGARTREKVRVLSRGFIIVAAHVA